MSKIKYIKRQDCGLKTTVGKSGDSGVNLSKEIFNYINLSGLEQGRECDINFSIYKKDYLDAVEFIKSQKTLYRTDSKSYEKIPSISELAQFLKAEADEFFGNGESHTYKCKLTFKNDGRIYLLGMKNDNFSVRDYLIEGLSAIRFDIVDETIELHTLTNILDNDIAMVQNTTDKDCRLILSDTSITGFAFKCISYFSEQPNWSNIENYIDDIDSLQEGDSVKVYSEGLFSLTGMFKCTTEEELSRKYNTPRRRWPARSSRMRRSSTCRRPNS